MQYRFFLPVILFLFTVFLTIEFVNAQSGGWKFINKTSISSEYIADVKVDYSGKGSMANINYNKLIKYTKPISRYNSKTPFYVENAKGSLSCFKKQYTTEILNVTDLKGQKIAAERLPFKKTYTSITQNSFEDKLFKQYCNPKKIAAAKETQRAEIREKNKDIIQKSNERKAEQAALKKIYQPLVIEYGDISSVDVCNPKSMIYRDCDYEVHTSFKIYGSLPKGVAYGTVPVFPHANTIFFKNGKIVKIIGDGKEKDVRAAYYKKCDERKKKD